MLLHTYRGSGSIRVMLFCIHILTMDQTLWQPLIWNNSIDLFSVIPISYCTLTQTHTHNRKEEGRKFCMFGLAGKCASCWMWSPAEGVESQWLIQDFPTRLFDQSVCIRAGITKKFYQCCILSWLLLTFFNPDYFGCKMLQLLEFIVLVLLAYMKLLSMTVNGKTFP